MMPKETQFLRFPKRPLSFAAEVIPACLSAVLPLAD